MLRNIKQIIYNQRVSCQNSILSFGTIISDEAEEKRSEARIPINESGCFDLFRRVFAHHIWEWATLLFPLLPEAILE